MDASFTAGLISGVAATLVGFLFTMSWDVWKESRTRKERDRAAFLALIREIEDHLAVATSNVSDLATESAIVGGNQMLIKPLRPFNARVWDLLSLSLPLALLKDGELLGSLRAITSLAATANEAIASRQRFKDGSQALTNFSVILGKMDADLLNTARMLESSAVSALERAKAHASAI